MTLNKHELRNFNRTMPNGDLIYLAWIEDSEHAVFQKEMPKKDTYRTLYSTIKVHKDDLTNGNFEYMIANNLTRN